jgi:YVTN family beta-propeller protein
MQSKSRRSIDLGNRPKAWPLSPDGKWVAAAVGAQQLPCALVGRRNRQAHGHDQVEGKNPEHAVFSPGRQMDLLVSAEESHAGRHHRRRAAEAGRARDGVDAAHVASAFLPDSSSSLVSRASMDSTVYVIDVQARKSAEEPEGRHLSQRPFAVAPRRQAACFISNGKDATVSVIDTEHQRIIATIPVGKSAPGTLAIHTRRQEARMYCDSAASNVHLGESETESNREAQRHPTSASCPGAASVITPLRGS